MAKITIAQLAREAGVSVATVDRLMNGREKVRAETALKIEQAARRLGYHGANAISSRVDGHRPELAFGFILQKGQHAFYQHFAEELQAAMEACQSHRIRIHLRFAETTQPGELAELVRSLSGKVQALAASGLDHHEVTLAVQDLRSHGIPTFSLLSDFAQGVRERYLGLNNLKVGRTVGWMMSRFIQRQGKVGIFIGGTRFHGHELRETGFRSSLREYAPHLTLLNPQVNMENAEFTYEATVQMLEEHPDLAGIYCAGGGKEGAITALREAGKSREVALVVNELTEETRLALQERVVTIVIGTPLRALCTELANMMVAAAENGMSPDPGQRFLPHEIWTPESL
ncbi:LacI family transcriptional regulator [Devosia crocina]|uniref:LacI family transcriptional regulator n=1 Tax=Devosia crocina TaxID=429728 RepID=A0A1I7N115_9HYPH|nr:LacI family DNA-binding transcriptional regulator [Devosia crocina]SFV28369.1 LacI family transcriptional regulator [Devosia crocina]